MEKKEERKAIGSVDMGRGAGPLTIYDWKCCDTLLCGSYADGECYGRTFGVISRYGPGLCFVCHRKSAKVEEYDEES